MVYLKNPRRPAPSQNYVDQLIHFNNLQADNDDDRQAQHEENRQAYHAQNNY